MSVISDKLEQLLTQGWNVKDVSDYDSWVKRVRIILPRILDAQALSDFSSFNAPFTPWSEKIDSQTALLEALLVQEQIERVPEQDLISQEITSQSARCSPHSKRIFLVHGHDTEVKQTVARFLEHLKLEPIVLHEQASAGRTVIEKLEKHSNVGFAVVLLTPDDVGGLASTPEELRVRARQNVVFELGFFIGRLSRRRVCALYKTDVEIPSDYHGVLYVEFDLLGAWRTKLAQELVEAGFSIDSEALIKS